MEYVYIALKLILGISMINVWLIQKDKPTKWRGGDAENIVDEFKAYGLPVYMCYLVGFLKVTLGILLIVSIWVPALAFPAAIGLALLLTGSIIMHFKINDPLYKSFPAFLFLLMCLFIAFGADLV